MTKVLVGYAFIIAAARLLYADSTALLHDVELTCQPDQLRELRARLRMERSLWSQKVELQHRA